MNQEQADKLREHIAAYCRASENVVYQIEYGTDEEHERAVDAYETAKHKMNTLLDELTVS